MSSVANDFFINIIEIIQEIYQHLTIENTTPVWEQLQHTLAQVSDEDAACLLAAPEIHALRPHLRALRASYEYADEAQWAQRLIPHPHPEEELTRYPCYAHFASPCSEWTTVHGFARVGAGLLSLASGNESWERRGCGAFACLSLL